MTTLGDLGQEAQDIDKPADDDLRLYSVTTIIDVLHKEGIVYWAAEQAAEAAIDNSATWQAMLDERGRDETIVWLRDARRRMPKTKLSDAKLGTVAHKVCETYALTGEKPSREYVANLIIQAGGTQVDVDGETNIIGHMLRQFEEWAQHFQPSYQATEVCVYSPTYGYAGQCDGFMTIDGVRFIIDYKSTRKPFDRQGKPKKPYPDQNALQLAAYRWAEFAAVWRPRRFEKQFRRYYALSPAEQELAVPVPEVDHGLVIKLTTDYCEAWPMECGKEVHEYFLYCLENFRWVNEASKNVMGEPLR